MPHLSSLRHQKARTSCQPSQAGLEAEVGAKSLALSDHCSWQQPEKLTLQLGESRMFAAVTAVFPETKQPGAVTDGLRGAGAGGGVLGYGG